MDYDLIKGIRSIEDFRRIPEDRLDELSAEIRAFMVDKVSKTGGHLASNLGVVELTIALQRVFHTPEDKLIFDVGHQTYVNKILTGRAAEFDTLRQKDGLPGFPKNAQSPFDAFNTGHSSTSVSAALGMLRAMKHKGIDSRAVAIIGDGAMTGGMAFEALNEAGECELPLIVVLNDNTMSISQNVGGLSKHLSSIRGSKSYQSFKKSIIRLLDRLPHAGPTIHSAISRLKSMIKYALLPNVLFEELGISYFGPVDGHDIHEMEKELKKAKNVNGPVLLHVVTVKGKGYSFAEREPNRFHGIGKFDPYTGQSAPAKVKSNSEVAGETLCELAEKDSDIAVITAAMSEGTGMEPFHKRFPDRFFDVGIAEQHAVTMAAGMAMGGMKPVFAVYSSFLQRGFDQVLHDVALQRLPVVFAVDRAGLVGADGETHQGVYDIAYLLSMPYVDIYSPASRAELKAMLAMAIANGRPAAVRYGRGALPEGGAADIEYGKWQELKQISPVTVIATGRMVEIAELAVNNINAGLINARFIKPVDADMMERIRKEARIVITVEDGIADGGFGSRIADMLSGAVKVKRIGVTEEPVAQATLDEQTRLCGMDEQSIRVSVLFALEEV